MDHNPYIDHHDEHGLIAGVALVLLLVICMVIVGGILMAH